MQLSIIHLTAYRGTESTSYVSYHFHPLVFYWMWMVYWGVYGMVCWMVWCRSRSIQKGKVHNTLHPDRSENINLHSIVVISDTSIGPSPMIHHPWSMIPAHWRWHANRFLHMMLHILIAIPRPHFVNPISQLGFFSWDTWWNIKHWQYNQQPVNSQWIASEQPVNSPWTWQHSWIFS